MSAWRLKYLAVLQRLVAAHRTAANNASPSIGPSWRRDLEAFDLSLSQQGSGQAWLIPNPSSSNSSRQLSKQSKRGKKKKNSRTQEEKARNKTFCVKDYPPILFFDITQLFFFPSPIWLVWSLSAMRQRTCFMFARRSLALANGAPPSVLSRTKSTDSLLMPLHCSTSQASSSNFSSSDFSLSILH